MTKKTLLALSASLLMGAAPAAAQTTPYGGYTGTEPLTSYGTRMMESYDVATKTTKDSSEARLRVYAFPSPMTLTTSSKLRRGSARAWS